MGEKLRREREPRARSARAGPAGLGLLVEPSSPWRGAGKTRASRAAGRPFVEDTSARVDRASAGTVRAFRVS
jgi:hypothetical protein